MLNRAVVRTIVVMLVVSVSILAQEKEGQGIESRTFVERREALMDALGEGVAVLYSQGRQTETGPV